MGHNTWESLGAVICVVRRYACSPGGAYVCSPGGAYVCSPGGAHREFS